MKTQAEISVREIKNECQDCGGTGRKYFKDVWEAVTYLEAKDFLIDQPLSALRQYQMENYIFCGYCRGHGYKIEWR